MKRKLLIVSILILCMLTTLIAGCAQKSSSGNEKSGTEQTGTNEGSTSDERKELKYEVLFVISKNRIPDRPSLLDQVLKEKFNIVVEWQDVPSSGLNEKINLLFATNQYPDMVWGVGFTGDTPKKLGTDGFLIPVNEYWDKLPNYRALWTDEEWETMLKFESNADGNLYYLPQKNYRIASAAWIYRKGAFDKLGLSFPETVEDLYNVLKTIKANDPNSIPMPNRGGAGGVLAGLKLAYRVKDGSYIDPDTGEFIPYGETTDAYREVLKWANKFYKEGLIDKEFATVTDEQWTERYANGKSYIEYSYAERDVWANTTMAAVDPNANWVWSPTNVTAYPEKGFMYDREQAHTASGSFFTDKMSEEQLERMLEFHDWLCTEEGSLFICMGVEGVTYEIKDGEPVFMPHMYHYERNPEGENDWKYGLYLGNIVQHPAYIKEVGKDANLKLSDAIKSNSRAKYFQPIPWKLTIDEEKTLADLETVVKDIRDEYRLKFIMGQLDPNDDKAWEEYKNALNKVGLDKVVKIRTEAYNRIK